MEVKTISDAKPRAVLNKGTHFENHLLPVEAQWAPVFGVVSGDSQWRWAPGRLSRSKTISHGHPQAPGWTQGLFAFREMARASGRS